MLYAYAVEEDDILAFPMGKHSAEAVIRMILKQLDIAYLLTDGWEAFKAVLPAGRHLVGKQYTKHIEGINTFSEQQSEDLCEEQSWSLKNNLLLFYYQTYYQLEKD